MLQILQGQAEKANFVKIEEEEEDDSELDMWESHGGFEVGPSLSSEFMAAVGA